METKDLLPLFCRDEKSGEPVCVNFFPTLCYFSAYQHFTPIYDILSHCFANIRRFALVLGVLIDIFCGNFAQAKISVVLANLCVFLISAVLITRCSSPDLVLSSSIHIFNVSHSMLPRHSSINLFKNSII